MFSDFVLLISPVVFRYPLHSASPAGVVVAAVAVGSKQQAVGSVGRKQLAVVVVVVVVDIHSVIGGPPGKSHCHGSGT